MDVIVAKAQQVCPGIREFCRGVSCSECSDSSASRLRSDEMSIHSGESREADVGDDGQIEGYKARWMSAPNQANARCVQEEMTAER